MSAENCEIFIRSDCNESMLMVQPNVNVNVAQACKAKGSLAWYSLLHTFILHTTLPQVFTAKPDVVFPATLQYCNSTQHCNIDVQVTRTKLQSLKSLTSCRSIVTLVFKVYYENKCKFVPQACNISIF